MGTYTRNRRSLALAPCGVHASESEIARDLQQFYQCSLAQASQFLQLDADPEPRSDSRVKVIST